MHEPVLINEVIKTIDPQKGDSYLDLTAGYGGHSAKILSITNNYKKSVLVDRDKNATGVLKTKFNGLGVNIIKSDFYSAAEKLVEGSKKFNIIFADLGVSSPHLDIASRGFSFKADGPLDMRMDQSQQLTAETIVNLWDSESIKKILREYGEEPHFNKITNAIIAHRPLTSTTKLANVIASSIGGKWQAKHPATRTFQALRIAVNNELGQLERSLPLWLDLLESNGRLGIITFHSLEDRIVKKFFNDNGGNRYDAKLIVLTKTPITATKQELLFNPRARSAKLRVAAKIKTTERTSDAY